jgi:hypothetical protein
MSLVRPPALDGSAGGRKPKDQMTYLQGLNCDQRRGYHFFRVMMAGVAQAVLAQNPVC